MVVSNLFWKPYNIRYQDFLGRLAFHQKHIKDELLLATIEDNATYRTKAINDDAELVMVSERGASVGQQTKELLEKYRYGMMSLKFVSDLV